ncbi:triphosphoribosyl-dephospho-CoA synthase CitG [uncultured Lactobacillus sp.]|uniref:triphosphoribosyl-dephospho-CoA synthase CitG n=1 Tax=uncultured Lactobacillus sp. TaxID=153152 RepID=UPI002804BF72|nr:triphosphoribosyl-dephospho-CoA synthase CitG [uncultured Lactobacillus sp.]
MSEIEFSIAQDAIRALLYEVVTAPKPGLVDPISSGPHPDMDTYLFIDSSLSLQPYFEEAVRIGANFKGKNLTEMFNKLRQAGIEAEKTMFAATNNVNTHKGAIFSLGVLVCAESYRETSGGDTFEIVKKMTKGLVRHDLKNLNHKQTAGEKEYLQYGKTGIRGEAEAGYPIVKDIALPFLKNSTGELKARLLDTLMKIATETEDSNLIKRAGNIQVLTWLKEVANNYLRLGGYNSEKGRKYLDQLNQVCLKNNYSLGGCADLLILTIFIGLRRNYI